MRFYDKLKEMDACSDAVEWAKQFSSLQKAWDKCERGDWMLWLVGNMSHNVKSRKKLVLCACECARLSLKYVKKGETRPVIAIETAEKLVMGEASINEVRIAADAAYGAAAYAAAAYAAYAAYGAAAYAAAARLKTLKKCADIVRKHYPKCPKI